MDVKSLIIIAQQVIFVAAVVFIWYYYHRRLRKEQQRSQKSERLQSVFLANESHALRTPLNSIIGFSDILLSDNEDGLNQPQREMAQQINQNGKRLLHFVDQLLELSNYESNIHTYTTIEVNLAELMASYRREILIHTQHSVSIRIKTHLLPNTKATLDTNLMHQLMKHLLMYVVEHSSKGYVTLEYERERHGLMVRIKDGDEGAHDALTGIKESKLTDGNGVKIPAEELSGIDFSVCKSIADALHGNIGTSENDESEVWVWIPCQMSDFWKVSDII